MVFRFDDQSSWDPYIIGSAQWLETSKSTCKMIGNIQDRFKYLETKVSSKIGIRMSTCLPLEQSRRLAQFYAKTYKIEDQHFESLG